MRLVARICLKTSLFSLPGVALALLVNLACTSPASGQTAPAYPELYRDPARTDQLTPADLPNLGRQVMLEATSMFVHARSELSDSPEAFRLLEQIRALWNEADAFTAAVSSGVPASQAMEAGALALPDLEAAFERVRSTLGILPGDAPRAAENLQFMSRAMAVIGPLVRQGLQETATTAGSAAGQRQRNLAILRAEARNIARAVQAVRAAVAGAGEPARSSSALDRELDVLSQLCLGLERIAVPWTDDRDVVSSVRPLRSQAQRIDFEAQSGRFPGSVLGQWSPIKSRIDDIAARYQLPREVVMRTPREAPPREAGAIASVEEAARAIDEYLQEEQSGATTRAPGKEVVEADARRLQSRLYLLRQQLLGQEAPQPIAQALLGVRTARRQFEARAMFEHAGRREELDRLLQCVDRATAAAGDRPSQTP